MEMKELQQLIKIIQKSYHNTCYKLKPLWKISQIIDCKQILVKQDSSLNDAIMKSLGIKLEAYIPR